MATRKTLGDFTSPVSFEPTAHAGPAKPVFSKNRMRTPIFENTTVLFIRAFECVSGEGPERFSTTFVFPSCNLIEELYLEGQHKNNLFGVLGSESHVDIADHDSNPYVHPTLRARVTA